MALLYGRADQTFYTRQIAREVAASVGAVQRELKNLTKVGLVIRTALGSQVFYQANRDAPIFSEMHSLVNKTVGIFSMLRSALHPLSTQVAVAFVYGSVARQAETAQSDIDLMVVGKASIRRRYFASCQRREEHWKTNKPDRIFSFRIQGQDCRRESFLCRAVLKDPKAFLLGDEDELGKVGGVRLAEAPNRLARMKSRLALFVASGD